MIDNGECWAVVLARAGSKGLPDKNIRDFAGKPLMAWSIEQAKANKCVDRVIVSSDGAGYLAVAREHGAEAHLRNEWAAKDDATNFDVLRDLVDTWARASLGRPKWIAVLQPTNPMRMAGTIDCMATLPTCNPSVDMVFTARAIGADPWVAWYVDSDDNFRPVAAGDPSDTWAAPRQRRPECLAANGNGWLMRTGFAMHPGTGHVVPIVEPYDLYHDIDTLDDFNRIEKLFIAQKGLTNGSRTPIHAEEYAYPD